MGEKIMPELPNELISINTSQDEADSGIINVQIVFQPRYRLENILIQFGLETEESIAFWNKQYGRKTNA